MSIAEAGIIHAKWCGHCKSLMPEWSKFKEGEVKGGIYKGIKAEAYEQEDDVTAIKKKGLEADSYPKFYTITKGGDVNYPDGVDRTKDGIKSWMDGLAGGVDKDTASTDTQPSEKKEGVQEEGEKEGGKKEGFFGMFGGKKKRSKRKSSKKKTSKRKTKKTKKTKKSKKSKRKTRKTGRK